MARVSTLLTKFPNGVAQFVAFAVGGSAGALTTVGGIASGDRLLQVLKVAFLTTAVLSAVTDLTAEFTITGSDTIDNTSGTSTANALVFVTFAKGANNA